MKEFMYLKSDEEEETGKNQSDSEKEKEDENTSKIAGDKPKPYGDERDRPPGKV